MSLPVNERLQIKYDKLNTKYNRLWEQTTNISLFILASVVAYSIAYTQYIMQNPLKWGLFLGRLIIPMLSILTPVVVVLTILLTLLFVTGREVHRLVDNYKVFS